MEDFQIQLWNQIQKIGCMIEVKMIPILKCQCRSDEDVHRFVVLRRNLVDNYVDESVIKTCQRLVHDIGKKHSMSV